MTVTRRDASHLLVAYGEEDAMLGAGEPGTGGLGQAAWVVDVDTAGTDNPSDDTIAISGGNQSLPGAGGQTP
jgi:hypothetical protein